MKLYFSPGSCSLSPHIVLRETGLPFELVQVDNRAKKTRNGEDFWAINPKGMVPTLALDDGQFLTEGPAIVQYVADRKPEAGLVPPAGTMQRYRVIEWLNYVTSEMHKGFTPIFRANTPENYKPVARENLATRLAYLDKHLVDRPYLTGDTYTIADTYLFVTLTWAARASIDISIYPNVKAFFDRVLARPKVQEAMKAEGLKIPSAA